jgi:hypothetical protein
VAAKAKETGTAADFVPADCAFFTSALRLGELENRVAASNAMKALLGLPFVQAQLANLRGQPQYMQFMGFLQTDPRGQAGLAVAKDIASREVFIYGDKEWVSVARSLGTVYGQVYLLSLRQQLGQVTGLAGPRQLPVKEVLSEVLANADHLYAPPLVIGFRIGDSKEQLQGLLEQLRDWVNAQPEAPARIEEVTLGEGKYFTFQVTGAKLIPADALAAVRATLARQGVPPDEIERFANWLTNLQLAVTAGFYRSYALLSIGRNNDHLARLGAGPALGASDELAPIRRFLDKEVVSLSYVSKEASAPAEFPANLPDIVGALLESVPQEKLPPGLEDRAKSDARKLAQDLAGPKPPATAQLAVTFVNRGLESYSFGPPTVPGLDYSKPLSILSHAGGDPGLAVATRAEGSRAGYETLASWVPRLYAYVGDFLVPTLSPDEREQFQVIDAAVVPFAHALDKTTRESLLPAIDGGQSLLLLDADLRLKQLFLQKPFPKTMPMVEPALVLELKDSEAFVRAMGEYLEAVDTLVNKLQALGPSGGQAASFRVPRPTSTPFGEGRMYFYQLPMPLDSAIMLHAVVTKDLLVLSASPSESERIIRGGTALQDPVVDLNAPAGLVVRLRTGELLATAQAWVDFALTHPQGLLGEEPPEAREAILAQTTTVWRVLGTVKGFTSRTFVEGPQVVTHTWLEIEDFSDAR